MIMAQVRPPDISSPNEVAPKRKTITRQPMQDRSKPDKYDVQQETTMDPRSPWCPQNKLSTTYLLYLPKQSLNNELWRITFQSWRTYIRNRSVLNTTVTTLDCVAKPTCSLNHIPKSPSYHHSLTDPLLTLIPPKPQSRGASLLPELQVRTYWSP